MTAGIMTGAVGHRRSFARLLSRLVWPMAALVLVVFAWVAATLIWTTEGANRTAANRQVEQLAAAVEQGLIGMRLRLAGATAPGPTLDALLRDPTIVSVERPLGFLEFTGLFIFALPAPDEDDTAVPAAIREREPLLGAVLARLRATMATDARTRSSVEDRAVQGVARLIYDGGVYAIVAVPLPPQADGRRLVAIACKHFDAADLRAIAELHGIKGLELSEAPARPGHMDLPMHDGQGQVRAHLSWPPNRPGDAILGQLLPSTLSGGGLALGFVLLILVCLRGIARDLARDEEQLRVALSRDPLSGLPNRRLFGERLDEELGQLARSGEGLAILLIDLDRFKEINDTFGHGAGDAVICGVAERVRGLLHRQDTPARLGGDEFAVILNPAASEAEADALARAILDALARPFLIGGTPMRVGASIGAVLAPRDGTDREALMRRADAALYRAKTGGRNAACLFRPEMDDEIRMRKLVEDELRRAIEGDGLELAYQPIFAADGTTPLAVEALVRWRHPERGLISPAAFIPVAEERGLIIPLGEWVLRQACLAGRRWPGLRIAVNISAVHVLHAGFADCVARILAETGLEPARLELELTESVLVADAAAAERAITSLRERGVRFALDDFGSGYSSLQYLRRFPFDTIKIDRSFVHDLDVSADAATLLGAIVSLGRLLGRTVTAEGIETREQQRLLQALGCSQLQGFLLSRPVPASEIDRLVGPPAAGVGLAA